MKRIIHWTFHLLLTRQISCKTVVIVKSNYYHEINNKMPILKFHPQRYAYSLKFFFCFCSFKPFLKGSLINETNKLDFIKQKEGIFFFLDKTDWCFVGPPKKREFFGVWTVTLYSAINYEEPNCWYLLIR